MKKENQRVVITKRMLKEALLDLLAEKNVDKISVTELCARAQINRATFYAHYETVGDVLREMEREFSRELIAKQTSQPNRTIKTDIDVMCAYFYEHIEFIRVAFGSLTGQNFSRMIDTLCEDVAADPHFSRIVDPDTLRLSATFFSGGIFCMLNTWAQEDIQKTPEEVSALIAKMLSSRILAISCAEETDDAQEADKKYSE